MGGLYGKDIYMGKKKIYQMLILIICGLMIMGIMGAYFEGYQQGKKDSPTIMNYEEILQGIDNKLHSISQQLGE